MKTAQELYIKAFSQLRDQRSSEYKAGVKAALSFRMGEASKMTCPYPAASAQSDAWHAGTDEGHRIWREEIDKQQDFKVRFDPA